MNVKEPRPLRPETRRPKQPLPSPDVQTEDLQEEAAEQGTKTPEGVLRSEAQDYGAHTAMQQGNQNQPAAHTMSLTVVIRQETRNEEDSAEQIVRLNALGKIRGAEREAKARSTEQQRSANLVPAPLAHPQKVVIQVQVHPYQMILMIICPTMVVFVK